MMYFKESPYILPKYETSLHFTKMMQIFIRVFSKHALTGLLSTDIMPCIKLILTNTTVNAISLLKDVLTVASLLHFFYN